jgi:serine/threonine protein kinase
MSLAPGSRIGPYEILGAIGTGGMGVVYKARDVRLRRDVAIKTLNADGGDDTARRFLREAQTASALNHPNIVTIYDIGTTEESGPYIAMEYIAGTTLRDLLSRGRLDTRAVLDISVQLARALSRAHVARSRTAKVARASSISGGRSIPTSGDLTLQPARPTG